MSQYLDTIVELQEALNDLAQARERLHGIPDWMRELHDEHAAKSAEIQALDEAAETLARDRRTAEGAITDAQEKLKKYQQQINRVSTQREYGALLQEIDTAKALVVTCEEQAFALLEKLEQTQRDLAARREAFAELDQRYKAELARWEEEKPAVAARVAELETRIAGFKAKLPRSLFSQFERIRERYGRTALATIRLLERPGGKGQREWHCGACNFRVRPQSMVEISNSDDLIQCDSCKRILLLPANPAAAAE
jgi:uncharacterized protein